MSTAKTKLDTGLVRELAAILREADLGEVEIEHDGLRIRVSKPAAPVMQSAVMAAPAAAARPQQSAEAAEDDNNASAAQQQEQDGDEPKKAGGWGISRLWGR